MERSLVMSARKSIHTKDTKGFTKEIVSRKCEMFGKWDGGQPVPSGVH
jgi:hypothetical protein